jgi:hypothetical protein
VKLTTPKTNTHTSDDELAVATALTLIHLDISAEREPERLIIIYRLKQKQRQSPHEQWEEKSRRAEGESSQSTKIVTRVINECRMKLSRKISSNGSRGGKKKGHTHSLLSRSYPAVGIKNAIYK